MKRMVLLLAAGGAAVLGLAAYVLFVERHGRSTGDALLTQGLVFPCDDTLHEAVTRIEIRREGQEIVLEKVSSEEWRLRQPVDAPADSLAVREILDGLAGVRAREAIACELSAGASARYGLDTPRLRVALWLGESRREFAVGATVRGQSRDELETYIRVGDEPRILLVDNEPLAALDKAPDQLRKRTADLPPAKK